MKKYYLFENNEAVGPYQLEELKSKNIKADTWICVEFEDNWQRATDLPELAPILQWQPPKPPTQSKSSPPPPPVETFDLPKKRSPLSARRIAIFAGVAAAITAGYNGLDKYNQNQDKQKQQRRELFVKDSLNTVRMQKEVILDSLTRERNSLTIEKAELNKGLAAADSQLVKTENLYELALVEKNKIEGIIVLFKRAEKERKIAEAEAKIAKINQQIVTFKAQKQEIETRLDEINEIQNDIDSQINNLK